MARRYNSRPRRTTGSTYRKRAASPRRVKAKRSTGTGRTQRIVVQVVAAPAPAAGGGGYMVPAAAPRVRRF